MKKIRIIGTMGSGKSYLGKELSKKFKVKCYSLDDLFWKKKFSVYEKSEVIEKRVANILKKKSWIVEGVHAYNYNLEKTFKDSDEIIWINPSIVVLMYRLVKRYFSRVFSKEESAKDSIFLIKAMLGHKFNMGSKSRQAYEDVLGKYKKKIVRVRSADKYLEGLN